MLLLILLLLVFFFNYQIRVLPSREYWNIDIFTVYTIDILRDFIEGIQIKTMTTIRLCNFGLINNNIYIILILSSGTIRY